MTPANVVVEQSTAVELYDRSMFPVLLDQSPEAVQARFAEQYAKATSLAELFNVLEGNSSKDLIGRKIEIGAVNWAPYESERGIIPLAICEGVDLDTGEVIHFVTTSSSLTMFIRMAELIDVLPFSAKITSKKTRSGQTALNFERV